MNFMNMCVPFKICEQCSVRGTCYEVNNVIGLESFLQRPDNCSHLNTQSVVLVFFHSETRSAPFS
jgi:hypothetical protein